MGKLYGKPVTPLYLMSSMIGRYKKAKFTQAFSSAKSFYRNFKYFG